MCSAQNKIFNGIAQSGRVANAYLFVGPGKEKKKEAAFKLADILNCQKQDRILIVPEGASIKINQIRELQSSVLYGPSISPYLMVVIEQADKMTDQAAAALLKTLEEPPSRVLFVLLAEREDKLAVTIRSRCQKIIFAEEMEGWEPKREYAHFYDRFSEIDRAGVSERLKLSAQLAKNRDSVEEILYDLVHFFRYQQKSIDSARQILTTLRHVKRRANLRLCLDVMCLNLSTPAAMP
jgi:DNA polymerase III delta prime subunit